MYELSEVYSMLLFSAIRYCVKPSSEMLEEMYNALSNLTTTSKDGKNMVPAILSVFKSFEDKFLNNFDQLRSDFLQISKDQDNKINDLSQEINKMKRRIDTLEESIDNDNAYERRDTLVLSGNAIPLGNKDENSAAIVCKVVKDHLNIVVNPQDLSVAHRLGARPTSQSPDKRKIIAKFCRRSV